MGIYWWDRWGGGERGLFGSPHAAHLFSLESNHAPSHTTHTHTRSADNAREELAVRSAQRLDVLGILALALAGLPILWAALGVVSQLQAHPQVRLQASWFLTRRLHHRWQAHPW